MNQDDTHIKMAFVLLQTIFETDNMLLDLQRERDTSRVQRDGSVVGHATKYRNRVQGHINLINDYFSLTPVYDDNDSRRRFRMRRYLFLRIVQKVQEADTFFVQKKDATGKTGFSAIQKVTAAIRQLAYGMSADAVDEYLRMGESTALLCLKKFTAAIIKVVKDEYLRRPNQDDMKRLTASGEKRHFPGMIGSIDCMHWQWKNCPKALHGQYQGRSGKPTIVLEAVADEELWFWHAFFGVPGSLNDINVLQRSPVFQDVLEGNVPNVEFEVNKKKNYAPYYLADGIYLKYTAFVKTITNSGTEKEMYFAKMQESVRKDVERAFGVLQAQFAIVKSPARLWSKQDLSDIMTTCIILHNMIVEDERGEDLGHNYEGVTPPVSLSRNRVPRSDAEFRAASSSLRDAQAHETLQKDFIEHLWKKRGDKVRRL